MTAIGCRTTPSRGSAFDEDTPETTVEVIISVNGATVASALANRFREDLTTLGEGSTGKYGFHFSFDLSLSPLTNNAVEIRCQQTVLLLPNGKNLFED